MLAKINDYRDETRNTRSVGRRRTAQKGQESTPEGLQDPAGIFGPTVWFFPDFLVWSDDKVLCVDTKGSHLVEPYARRKLLAIEPHKDVTTAMEVKFMAKGSWNTDGTSEGKDGFSVLTLGSDRNLKSNHFEELDTLVKSFK